jgi:elongation factor Ts
MLAKHFKEICFLDQAFIKEDKLSVEQKMKQVAKEANCKLEITGFQLYTTGA